MPKTLTNAHQSDVDSGSVVNEVRLTYNEFGQLVQDFQAHGRGGHGHHAKDAVSVCQWQREHGAAHAPVLPGRPGDDV